MVHHPDAAPKPIRRAGAASRRRRPCPPVDTWVDDLEVELAVEPDPHQAAPGAIMKSRFPASLAASTQAARRTR